MKGTNPDPREVQVFDEFLEVFERPTESRRTYRVHTEEPTAPHVEEETTHTYRDKSGVLVAVTCRNESGDSKEEIRRALENAVGELESEMEAKERALDE
jgi:Asp-tRNA(Asn)/Glu-tRNA(Gln) amidotransferase A subunit family amidase